MITKGSMVRAVQDHYDDYYGDIFIARGDRFKVIDHLINDVKLSPIDPRKYPGENEIRSREEMFHACED